MTDPIADILTRIRNAQAVHQAFTEAPFSSQKLRIIQILLAAGFLKDYKKIKKQDKKFIVVYLRYNEKGEPIILKLKRISRPGKRVYKKAKEIKRVRSGYGMAIISTPKGMMTNRDASKQRLGGEVICEIW